MPNMGRDYSRLSSSCVKEHVRVRLGLEMWLDMKVSGKHPFISWMSERAVFVSTYMGRSTEVTMWSLARRYTNAF